MPYQIDPAYAGRHPDCIHLDQVAAKLEWLDVACRRCDRRGRLSVARLLAEHGPDMRMPILADVLASDCPQHAAQLYQRCSICFPQLVAWFGGPTHSPTGGEKPPAAR